jgi:hypothetical protein
MAQGGDGIQGEDICTGFINATQLPAK